MKKNTVKILCSLLAASMLAFAGCSKKDPAPKDPAPAETQGDAADQAEPTSSLAGKTLKVACSATFVPYESVSIAPDGTKTYTGMNIDILNAIAEKLDFTIEYEDMPFKSIIGALQAGRIDLASGGMQPTDERRQNVDFSDIFFYPRNAIVYKEGAGYTTLDSLTGKKIAYVFGTNYQQIAESVEGAETSGIQGSPACIEEVKTGRVDACIIDGAGATEFLKANEGLELSLLDKTEDCFAFVFPKDSPYREEINAVLKEMMENGELDAIVSNHLSEEFILQ